MSPPRQLGRLGRDAGCASSVSESGLFPLPLGGGASTVAQQVTSAAPVMYAGAPQIKAWAWLLMLRGTFGRNSTQACRAHRQEGEGMPSGAGSDFFHSQGPVRSFL